MSLRSWVIPAALAALCSACQTVPTTKESAVGVNRPQHMMVSADAMDETVNAALAAGARAYVTKPLAFDEVLRQIDAVMAGGNTTITGTL